MGKRPKNVIVPGVRGSPSSKVPRSDLQKWCDLGDFLHRFVEMAINTTYVLIASFLIFTLLTRMLSPTEERRLPGRSKNVSRVALYVA